MKGELFRIVTTNEKNGKQYSTFVLRFDNGVECFVEGVSFNLPVHQKNESKEESDLVEKKIANLKQYAHDNNRRLYDFATTEKHIRKIDGTDVKVD